MDRDKLQRLNDAIKTRKEILEYMKSLENKDGISKVTISHIASHINLSRTRVSQIIMQLNTLDVCVEKISAGCYRIHYTDIENRGIFAEILSILPLYIRLADEGKLEGLMKVEKVKLLDISIEGLDILEGYIR